MYDNIRGIELENQKANIDKRLKVVEKLVDKLYAGN